MQVNRSVKFMCVCVELIWFREEGQNQRKTDEEVRLIEMKPKQWKDDRTYKYMEMLSNPQSKKGNLKPIFAKQQIRPYMRSEAAIWLVSMTVV